MMDAPRTVIADCISHWNQIDPDIPGTCHMMSGLIMEDLINAGYQIVPNEPVRTTGNFNAGSDTTHIIDGTHRIVP